MSPLFSNIPTTLDLNGPELSILQATTLESGESSFSISPSLPDGSTKIDLVSLEDFSAFDSSKIYTLTANGTFDLTLDLEGAGGGNGGTTNFGTGGKGGKVTGTVSFILGEEYKLVIGSAGEFNAGAGAVGGGGASSGIGDASQPATYKWSDGVEASSWFESDLSENMFDGSTTNFSKAETKFGTTSTINTYLGWDKDGNNLAFDLNLPAFEAPLEIFIKSAEIYTYTVNGIDVTSDVDVSAAMPSGSWITLTSDTTVGISSFRVTAPNPNTNVQISAVRSNGILMTTTLTYSAGGSGGGYTGIFKTSISQENALLIAGGGGGASAQDDPNAGANPARKANGGDGGGLTGGYIKPNANAILYDWASGVLVSGWSASNLSSFMFDGRLNRFSKAETNGRKIDLLGWSRTGNLPILEGPVEIWIAYAQWGGYQFVVNGVSVTPDTTGSQGEGAWVKISDGPVNAFIVTAKQKGLAVMIAGVKSNGVLLSSSVPYVNSDPNTENIIKDFLVSGRGGTQTISGEGGTTNSTENYGSNGAALLGGAGNIFNSTGGGGGGYFGGGGGGYFVSTINGSGGGGSGFIATTNVINGYFSSASNIGAGKVNFIRSTFADKGLILSGIATAKFPDSQTEKNTNTGDITYRWYEDGVGPLSDSASIVGSATTTLNMSDISFADNGRKFFLRADYTSSAYGSIGAAKSTPNAYNEPLDFSTFTLGVAPSIIIVTQPEDSTVVQDIDTTFSVTASIQDGTNDSLSFDWQYNGQSLSGSFLNLINSQVETSIIGGRQSILTIRNSVVELSKISCIISSVNASSSISSDTANLDVSVSRTFIRWEKFGNATRTEQGNRDLATSGPFTARALASNLHRTIQMWSPERDIDVKITMGGAAGAARNNNRGGEGGISVFKMTMKQNTEYTIKLGVNSFQGGGPRGGTNGGGGLAAIYEKARVLAVCGGGGGAGGNGRGGDGGGLNVVGESAPGGGGFGGAFIGVDALPSTGASQAGRTGYNEYDNDNSGSGRLSGCTIGRYWNQQGKLPCEDLGNNVEFLTAEGATYSPTTGIERGYKVGQGHRNNGGAGAGNGAGGGAGARGGQGSGQQGGGGASGYYTSQVELLSSSTLPNGTTQGGNADVAFISVEVYDESLDGNQQPLIPPTSGVAQAAERTVTWTVTRSTTEKVGGTFTLTSGTGPSQIGFGPSAATKTSQITSGSVYTLTSTSADNKNLNGNTLTLSDDDGEDNHGAISITSDIGRFSDNETWVANW